MALALAACAAPAPKDVKPLANLSGTVTFREPITLSPDAMLTVELVDVSLQDAPAKVLAEQIISNPGQSPIPFELSYDPDAIVPNHSYAVQARIEWEGAAGATGRLFGARFLDSSKGWLAGIDDTIH